MQLNVDSRLSQIFEFEETCAAFDTILPGMRARVEGQPATLAFSARKLISYARGAIPEAVVDKLDAALRGIVLEGEDEGSRFAPDRPLTAAASEIVKEAPHTAITPGQPWRDTNGVRIQAHGGAMFYEDGVYYWYGENKDRTDGKGPVWTWGLRAYSSTDLYNWQDLGLIIPPDLTNPESGLYPTKHVDRPHIIKCPATGKYICWIKQSGEEACFLILQADAFTGPYTIVKEAYRPRGYKVGDFDIALNGQGDTAYLYMDADHAGIVTLGLSADFLSAENEICWQYKGLHAPFCREAPAVFARGGKKYMLTSGMTGYIPNKSDSAMADGWTQPFASTGDPHANDASRASFNSQISKVFKVEGKQDLYIAMADRWVPGWPVDAVRADILERSIASHYEPEKYSATPEEQKLVMDSPMLESADTSVADYVWLPLRFEGDKVKIDWHESWKIEDYK